MTRLGKPHLHYSTLGSTNDRARELVGEGAAHGTIVTADEQTAGRGRRGRSWQAPAGQALLLSVLLREAPDLLTLRVAVAAAAACGDDAQIKWPNDVLIDGRTHAPTSSKRSTGKVAGILCEQQPGADWAVAGIGVNVAVDLKELDPELRQTAGTLGQSKDSIGPFRDQFLEHLAASLKLRPAELLEQWSARDALAGQQVEWDNGTGTAVGVDSDGRLLVDVGGKQVALDSGEVSLVRSA